MKRSVVVCVMAGVLLAMSTAALATTATATLASGELSYDKTVSSGFKKSEGTITWFQPYVFAPPAPDPVALGYPEGGTLTLEAQITSAKLTIVANGVSPVTGMGPNPQQDSVSRSSSSSGPWTAIVEPGPVYLKPAKLFYMDSTTVIDLTDADTWLKGTEGYHTRVKLTNYPTNQEDAVKSARLQVTTQYTYTYTYTPKKVIFVSAMHASGADVNVPGDKGFVDLLEAAHYEVDYRAGSVAGTGYWEGTLDPNQLADLEAADLVIISRDGISAGVGDDDAKRAAWAGVKAPIMLLNSYVAAGNRWDWINSSSSSAREAYYMLKALDLTHPVFKSVTFESSDVVVDPNAVVDPNKVVPVVNDIVQWYDPNAASGYASFTNAQDAGSGQVLAVRPDSGNILIAEWMPGKPFHAYSGFTPAGHRMFFNAGTQEIPNSKLDWGVMNLNAQGQKMFLNAVAYMIIPVPVEITLINPSFELPGTVKIKGWNAEGVAGTPAVDIPGWSSDTAVADSGVETGYTPTDGLWTAFLMGADPSIWQSTGFVIETQDIFQLSVDARNTWQGTTLRMTLYYEDGALRVPAATADVTVTDTMQTFTLPLAAKDVPGAVGKVLGVEFDNVTTNGESWIGLDRVRLTVK